MRYKWSDNPTAFGSKYDCDLLNDCLMHLKYENNAANNQNLFDVKITDRILDESESYGWSLQGSLVNGNYAKAINKIKNEYETAEIVKYYENFEYKIAANGHLIADISQKAAIDKYFMETGIADFYIYDPERNQFYLPRNKWFMQFTIDTSNLNEYQAPGIPDHWHFVDEMPNTKNRPRGDDRTNCTTYYETKKTRLASECNPIYGNSDSVQPPSSLKLLYYFVGESE